MKIWVIKHKGPDYWRNYFPDFEITLEDDTTLYASRFFFRRKDAVRYLKTYSHPELYEVVGKS